MGMPASRPALFSQASLRLASLGRASAIAAVVCSTASWIAPAALADTAWPTRVVAGYKVVVAGFELGTFNFTSTTAGNTYSLAGQADLTWGLGIFNWKSDTRASGTFAGDVVRPAGYTFDFKANSKTGGAKMGFTDGNVTSHATLPPSSTDGAGYVPLKDTHLRAVFDPLSALMAVSRGGSANPCGRRIGIFDGKQRFDLIMTFRRQEQIKEAKPSGQPTVGYVCRVQYIPLGGYKNNKATQDMAANAGIEVLLRPVPSANMLVPQTITIPTAVGHAVLAVQRVDITAPGNKQIALGN